MTDGQARIKTFSLRGDELARLQEAHANGEALLQTDKTPDSDSETEAPADPNKRKRKAIEYFSPNHRGFEVPKQKVRSK